MKEVALIAAFGAMGAVVRHGVNLAAARGLPEHFPWGTLLVNVVGCFLIGIVFSAAQDSKRLSPELALAIAVGFLGSLTTVSGFALQTWRLGENHQFTLAALNVAANLVLSLFAVWGGLTLARNFLQAP